MMLQSFDGGVSPILDSHTSAVSEVLEKAVLIAKHLITVSYLLPRSLLFDACGSVSNFNRSAVEKR